LWLETQFCLKIPEVLLDNQGDRKSFAAGKWLDKKIPSLGYQREKIRCGFGRFFLSVGNFD